MSSDISDINVKKKILIVDDEVALIETLKMRLEFDGYEVLTAGDGQEGLERVQEAKPSLILLDVMMPRMNGYQVCRELKQDDATKEIPVIMLTAKAQESDKYWGKEVGANGYLTKPFKTEDLLEKIKKYIG